MDRLEELKILRKELENSLDTLKKEEYLLKRKKKVLTDKIKSVETEIENINQIKLF